MANEDKHKNSKKYAVNIFGEEMIVIGDVSQDYVKELAGYINKMGEEIKHAYPRLPRRRLFGLSLINLADEYFKLRDKYIDRVKEKKQLENENEKLRKKINSLQKNCEDLSILLEEVDG